MLCSVSVSVGCWFQQMFGPEVLMSNKCRWLSTMTFQTIVNCTFTGMCTYCLWPPVPQDMHSGPWFVMLHYSWTMMWGNHVVVVAQILVAKEVTLYNYIILTYLLCFVMCCMISFKLTRYVHCRYMQSLFVVKSGFDQMILNICSFDSKVTVTLPSEVSLLFDDWQVCVV